MPLLRSTDCELAYLPTASEGHAYFTLVTPGHRMFHTCRYTLRRKVVVDNVSADHSVWAAFGGPSSADSPGPQPSVPQGLTGEARGTSSRAGQVQDQGLSGKAAVQNDNDVQLRAQQGRLGDGHLQLPSSALPLPVC